MSTITLNLKARRETCRFKWSVAREYSRRHDGMTDLKSAPVVTPDKTSGLLVSSAYDRKEGKKTNISREGIDTARSLMRNFRKNRITPKIERLSFSTVRLTY